MRHDASPMTGAMKKVHGAPLMHPATAYAPCGLDRPHTVSNPVQRKSHHVHECNTTDTMSSGTVPKRAKPITIPTFEVA
jgi:hypothetical protein